MLLWQKIITACNIRNYIKEEVSEEVKSARRNYNIETYTKFQEIEAYMKNQDKNKPK